jgi:hypothetical protein
MGQKKTPAASAPQDNKKDPEKAAWLLRLSWWVKSPAGLMGCLTERGSRWWIMLGTLGAVFLYRVVRFGMAPDAGINQNQGIVVFVVGIAVCAIGVWGDARARAEADPEKRQIEQEIAKRRR